MTMREMMANDLAALFADSKEQGLAGVCKIGNAEFDILMDDALSEEQEAYGGPELVEIQRIHFQTRDLPSIANGSKLAIKAGESWKSKIVVSAVTSSDGNELIATVRGD